MGVEILIPSEIPPATIATPMGPLTLPEMKITLSLEIPGLRELISRLSKLTKAVEKPTVTVSEGGKPPAGYPTITGPGGVQIPMIRRGYYFVATLDADRRQVAPGEQVVVTVKVEMYVIDENRVVARQPVPGASVTLWDYYFNPAAPPQSKTVRYVVGTDTTDSEGVCNFALTLTDEGVHRFTADVEIPSPIRKETVTNSVTVAVGATIPSREEYQRLYEKYIMMQTALKVAGTMGALAAVGYIIYRAVTR